MPTYQYTCTECGEPLEAVQSFTDAALTECPQCGGRLRKVFSAVGVVFKGSGFYRTDSRAKTHGSGAKDPAAATAGPGDSSSGDKGSGGGDSSGADGSSSSKPASEGSSSGQKSDRAAGTSPAPTPSQGQQGQQGQSGQSAKSSKPSTKPAPSSTH